MAYSDPFGLCPEKAKNGTFCFDLWIRAKRVLGLKGDGRGPDATASPAQSRAQILIDPQAGTATHTVSKSCLLWCTKPLGSPDNRVSATKDADGVVMVDFRLKNSAFYGAGPDLDGRITFSPNADGTWETHGNVTAFPSNALYQMVDGKWQPVRPPHEETEPADLIDGRGRDSW